MWPDRVSNPAPLTLESDVIPTAPRVPALIRARARVCVRSYMYGVYCNSSKSFELILIEHHRLTSKCFGTI